MAVECLLELIQLRPLRETEIPEEEAGLLKVDLSGQIADRIAGIDQFSPLSTNDLPVAGVSATGAPIAPVPIPVTFTETMNGTPGRSPVRVTVSLALFAAVIPRNQACRERFQAAARAAAVAVGPVIPVAWTEMPPTMRKNSLSAGVASTTVTCTVVICATSAADGL